MNGLTVTRTTLSVSVLFVLTPFALKVAAFRFTTTVDSPARVSDVVGVRSIQSAAANVMTVGSLLRSVSLLANWVGGGLLWVIMHSVAPICSAIIATFVFFLCQRICPRPETD